MNFLSCFSSRPQVLHMDVVKHLLRYLKGTIDFGLLYRRGEDSTLTGSLDSDWAGDKDDQKSTSGYLFLLGSTPITWRSQKQPCIALSSTEAEYIALSSCAKEGIWLHRLLSQLRILDSIQPTKILCDNQGAISLSENPVFHARTKHIQV